MRRKGYPHGDLPDEEKAFLARRKASIDERRREREENREVNSGENDDSKSAEAAESAEAA